MDYPYDLGGYSRPVSTPSSDAQRWFDLGLNWTYGFNHEEAVRCFTRAIEADPDCAMAHWGIAYAYGPYINKVWAAYDPAELAEQLPTMHDHARRAVELARARGTDEERALCEAITARCPSATPPPEAMLNQWLHDFAAAMAEVYQRFPGDEDVIAVYVEAMMMRTPWLLWDLDTNEPCADASTPVMIEVLDAGLGLRTDGSVHPGIAHMAVHTWEMSGTPERAEAAADGLRGLSPDNGHLNHMPSHIDVLCGRYLDAVEASERAIAADERFLRRVGPFTQYTAAICHDNHLMMFASMFLGRWESAIAAADRIVELARPEVLEASTRAFRVTLDAYVSMRMHVFVRFGRWEEILEQPLPDDPDLFPVSVAMHHYAVAVAHAALGHHDQADGAAAAFERAFDRVEPERRLFNNETRAVLSIARAMMRGEMAYHRGDHEVGYEWLRDAVARNDGLAYTEPWAWMHPPRHALAALLLEHGHVEEAEAAYRADLGLDGTVRRSNVHPDNVWAMHGLVECLLTRGEQAEAAPWQAKLAAAQQLTDVAVSSSCACRG